MSERYYCLNCTCFDVLNQQGRCSKCDSDSVISENAVRSAAAASEGPVRVASSTTQVTPRYSPNLTLFCVRYGPFYTTLYAKDAEDAKRIADTSVEKTWQVEVGVRVSEYCDSEVGMCLKVEPAKRGEFVSSS